MRPVIIVVFCWLLISIVWAEPVHQDSLSIKSYTLSPVRVIADRLGSTIGNASYKSVLRGEESAPLNLKDAFQALPGVSITVGAKDESNIRIRGFRKNEVRIMIDGRPLTSGYFGNIDLNSISIQNIENLIYIKGPSSALYGTNTMGGVVNLITTSPPKDKWFKAGVLIKRNNTHHLELSSAHSFSFWDYNIYASRSHTDGFVLSNDFTPTALENGGVRNNNANTQYSYSLNTNAEIATLHNVGLSLSYSSIGIKQIASSVYESKHRRLKDWKRYSSSVNLDNYLADQYQLFSSFFMDAAGDTYQEFNDPNYSVLGIESAMLSHTLGNSTRLQADMANLGLANVGLRVERHLNKRRDNGFYPSWTHSEMTTYNAFWQHQKELLPRLNVFAGVGLSAFELSSTPDLRSFLEPTISVLWQGEQGMHLSIALGRNLSYPTMRQLFAHERGNPHLKPQRANKYELSAKIPLQYFARNIVSDASIFFNDVVDLIDIKDGKYQNLDNVKTYGLELGLSVNWFSGWHSKVDYSFLDTYQSSYIICESPIHSWVVSHGIKLPWSLQAMLSSSYTGKRYSQDSGFFYHSLDSFWLHNLQISRKWGTQRVYAGIENVLDKHYEMEYGYPGAGLNFNVGIEVAM